MQTLQMKEVKCDVCETGKLKAYQLNVEEAIFLCTNEECLGHLNKPDITDYIVKRKLSDIDCELEPPKKKQKIDQEAPVANEICFQDDFLDQLLDQHNVWDPQFDISDIIEDKDNSLLQEIVESLDFGENSVSCSNTSDSHLMCLPQTQGFDQAENNDCVESKKQPHLHTETLVVTRKSQKGKLKSAKCAQVTKSNDPNETGNTDERVKTGDFMEACMCLLMHNRHVLSLKFGRNNLIKRLQEFYKRKYENAHVKGKPISVENIRRDFLLFLRGKKSCWKPDQTLPVYAMPTLVNFNIALKELFWCTYRWEVSCTTCSKKESAVEESVLLILDKVPKDFTMTRTCCVVSCSFCRAANQNKMIVYYVLPKVVAVHFTDGVPHTDISTLDFYHREHIYKVTEVIQQEDVNHFSTWCRNLEDESWTCHGSLESQPFCSTTSLDFKASEFHIVLWERQEQKKCRGQPVVLTSSRPLPMVCGSLPGSPNPKPLLSPLGSDKTRADRKSGLVPNIFARWPKSVSSRNGVRDSIAPQVFHSQENETDLSIPSPSSSDVSNASDGDVTMATSLFRAPLRNARTPAADKNVTTASQMHPWKEENLEAHQKKWSEWRFHLQNPQSKRTSKTKLSPSKCVGKKQTKTVEETLISTNSGSANNLLSGIDIFMK